MCDTKGMQMSLNDLSRLGFKFYPKAVLKFIEQAFIVH